MAEITDMADPLFKVTVKSPLTSSAVLDVMCSVPVVEKCPVPDGSLSPTSNDICCNSYRISANRKIIDTVQTQFQICRRQLPLFF